MPFNASCALVGILFRTRNLCCGFTELEPGFEASLAEPCGIVRQECSEAQFRAGVSRFGVTDDLAGIFECGQSFPHQFVYAKLFGTSYFDSAICRRTYGDPGYGTRDIVS